MLDGWTIDESERHDGKPQIAATKVDADGDPVRDPATGVAIRVVTWGRVGCDRDVMLGNLTRECLAEEVRLAPADDRGLWEQRLADHVADLDRRRAARREAANG